MIVFEDRLNVDQSTGSDLRQGSASAVEPTGLQPRRQQQYSSWRKLLQFTEK